MAEIVFGFGTSHGPLLATPPHEWDLRANVDRKNKALAFGAGTFDFAGAPNRSTVTLAVPLERATIRPTIRFTRSSSRSETPNVRAVSSSDGGGVRMMTRAG